MYLEVAVDAAKQAGEILITNLGKIGEKQISNKGINDYVTYVDKLSEEKIISIIKKSFPTHRIKAEESGEEETESTYRWIIDPLDGTTNYIHSFPVFGISVALEKDKDLILGVIYDPLRQELFTAQKGKGAFLNGQLIKVSNCKDISSALLATGFPFRSKDKLSIYEISFRRLFLASSGVRRLGAAAIDLCYLACGRIDGFWELGLSWWDIAAGIVIIREAGGIISDWNGEDTYSETGNIVAANKFIHPQIISHIHGLL